MGDILALGALVWAVIETVVRWNSDRKAQKQIASAELRAREAHQFATNAEARAVLAHGFASNAEQRAKEAEVRADQSLELQRRSTEAMERMAGLAGHASIFTKIQEDHRWNIRVAGFGPNRIVYEITNLLDSVADAVTVEAAVEDGLSRDFKRIPNNVSFGALRSIRFFELVNEGVEPIKEFVVQWDSYKQLVPVVS